ncbi:hypothetical protein GCM10009837_26500 [Streptomyces durmitorensis]|uniref:ATP-binding protein n=1 Tax=Streptomyces durmitorensis TaxID=319947 RepID=A0ABY4PTE5_9ACTN|nr:hypothetical protein [Streptomyces durmitorensis]UQT56690.1 hypothetical protein M4V62_17180 [Streptomyces durmitorensis]
MARHATASTQLSRALLRAGLTVTVAGAALGIGGAATASAAPAPAPPASDQLSAGAAGALFAVQEAAGGGLGPVKELKLDPLAGTGVDPLDNAVGTRIADFKPVTTAPLTAPLTQGGSLDDLPLVGPATGLLPG